MALMRPGLLGHLRSHLDSLTGMEQRVAQWILDQPVQVLNMSIRDLAQAAGVSEATVVRSAQRLGYDGFPQFKLALAFDLSAQPGARPQQMGEVQIGDDLPTLVGKIFETHLQALTRTRDQIDLERLDQAVQAIMAARRLEVISGGHQAFLPIRCVARFIATGISCVGRTDPLQYLPAAAILDPSDVLLIFSHSGRVKTLVQAAEMARDRGAVTIGVTNFPHSPLARTVAVPLFTHGADTLFYNESMGSEAAQMAVMDAIVVSVATRRAETVLENLITTRQVVEDLRR